YYNLACGDGEEGRLHELAKMVDERLKQVKEHAPGIGEDMVFVMGLLMMADELLDLQEKGGANDSEASASRPQNDNYAANVMDAIAERLESFTQALEKK